MRLPVRPRTEPPSALTMRVSNDQRTNMDRERLTHLQQLEAESIHIIREVAAEFENPV